MIDNGTKISLTAEVDINFQKGLETAPTFWQKIASTTKAKSAEKVFTWMAQVAGLVEWVGPLAIKAMEKDDYTIRVRTFADAIRASSDDIEDGSTDINSAATDLGDAAAKWPDDLVAEAIKAGTTALCFDKQPFFHASHPINRFDPSKGTQSNLHASLPLTQANLALLHTRMVSQKKANGKKASVRPTTLVVPAALEFTAKQLLAAPIIIQNGTGSAGVTNITAGMYDLIVIPELDEISAEDWYLGDLSKSVKPLIFVDRLKAEFVETAKYITDENAYRWVVKARGAVGYGLYHLLHKAKAGA